MILEISNFYTGPFSALNQIRFLIIDKKYIIVTKNLKCFRNNLKTHKRLTYCTNTDLQKC